MKVYCVLAEDGMHYHSEHVKIKFDEDKAVRPAERLNKKSDKLENGFYYVEAWRVIE